MHVVSEAHLAFDSYGLLVTRNLLALDALMLIDVRVEGSAIRAGSYR